MIKALISTVRSGIVRLAIFKASEQVGSGSGFLSNGFIITNSHVVREIQFDAVEITFGDRDSNPITPIRYASDTLFKAIVAESSINEFDYAIIKINEPELNNRYNFLIKHTEGKTVGEQILFFGFPFGSQHLTSHIGYISADYMENRVRIFQIDGSINPGNSGGPLINIASGEVIGVVTRTQTGLEKDFDELLKAIQGNIKALEQAKGMIVAGGIDPIQATQITMNILGRLGRNIKRSANVGIGYAFSAEHILKTGLFK